MMPALVPRDFPEPLRVLPELALDLHWTWSHAGDALWQTVSPTTWERTRNPWAIVRDLSQERLAQLTQDTRFLADLQRFVTERAQYLTEPGWYGRTHGGAGVTGIVYFSLEFGLGEAFTTHPVQIIVAGKAHLADEEGKQLVQAWADFVRHPGVCRRAVFLEDYDMSLAQELVQGVDVWLNTPRRP
jgi:glucan phosphorylase